MPLTISRAQREAIYETVIHHLTATSRREAVTRILKRVADAAGGTPTGWRATPMPMRRLRLARSRRFGRGGPANSE